ncbi:HNH endonuclease family protein [Specibacter sp. RAF43]|uniref:HNH endonuclease family protein n=1 Tax=Specibacter sp. RAF43 TaxID=3233057 RepID=UPI003F94AB7B
MKILSAHNLAATALAAALLLTGCSSLPSAESAAAALPHLASNGGAAVTMLNTLPVKGKAAKTGYTRAQFGQAWKDVDRNGCDTRNDVLKRDFTGTRFSDAKKCAVTSGMLKDPYTAKSIRWVKGGNTVDIDHVVALGQAWVAGAQHLSLTQRTALANDPLNLLAVDAHANRAKGDREASAWLPANKAFRCVYVATQIAVKKKYALSVTSPEKAMMLQMLKPCPKQGVPKVIPIKPAGTSAVHAAPKPAPKPPVAVKPVIKPAVKPAPLAKVSPGAFCSTNGAKGIGKSNGKTYTCKKSSTDTRLRWRV